LDGRSIEEIVFLWFFVSLGLHQWNDDFVPVSGEFMQNFKSELGGDFFAGTGGFLEPAAANFFMGTAAFLEPTEEDGDFFTGVLVS
jgi:hypothetical protein